MLSGTVKVPIGAMRVMVEARVAEAQKALVQQQAHTAQLYEAKLRRRQEKVDAFIGVYRWLTDEFPKGTLMEKPGSSFNRPMPTIYLDQEYYQMMRFQIESRMAQEPKPEYLIQPHSQRNGRPQVAFVLRPPIVWPPEGETTLKNEVAYWSGLLAELPTEGSYTLDVEACEAYGIAYNRSEVVWSGIKDV